MHVESNNDLQNLENSTNERTREGSIMNSHMLLKDYIRVWLETFKQNSIKSASYDRLLTSLAALDGFDIARMAIEDITFFDIQRYINELVDRGYALTTIKKQTRIVTAPLKQAAAMRVLPADPAGAEGFEPSTKVLETYTSKGYDVCGYSCKLSGWSVYKSFHQFHTPNNERSEKSMEHVTFCGGEISIIAELLRNRIRELKMKLEVTDDNDEMFDMIDEIEETDNMLKEIERQTGWKVRAAE